jgi:hypothetical protein
VLLEGLGKLKKSNDLSGNQTCDLPACSNRLCYCVPHLLTINVSSVHNEGPKSYMTYLIQTSPCNFALMGIYTGFQGLEVCHLKMVLRG